MKDLVPVSDDHELIVMPNIEHGGFHGKVFVLMKNGRRWMKVPATIVSWRAADTNDIHFRVSDLDTMLAEEWQAPARGC
jgi:hypothetical protein